MPSFYPRSMPRQMPLTPPEFVPGYNSNGGVQYTQAHYNQSGIVNPEKGGYDFAERYGHPSLVPSNSMYQPPASYHSGPLSQQNIYYEPMSATILPPMRVPSGPSMGESGVQHQQQQQDSQHRVEQQAKEEKPVGGVSAKLDYDMEYMTDFVSEMAQGIVQPGRPMPPSFRKWVHQVLCATRLPSATILLSLHYLSVRMTMLSTGGQYKGSEVQIYRLLTIALLLGSKFLDDNTFINRSWSEVSGISVTDLNQLETEWLVAIEFKLHRDPAEQQGFNSWLDHWKEYERQAIARSRATKLSPIDTTVQHAANKQPPPAAYQTASYAKPTASEFVPKSQYNPPAYSQYDPWLVPRPSMDSSPGSAPVTGPTTPEFYGGPGTWAPPEGYSRRTMFGFPSLSQPQAHALSQPQTGHYGGPIPYTPQYSQPMWNSHAINCSCYHCVQRHPSYFMSHGYGPQPVVG